MEIFVINMNTMYSYLKQNFNEGCWFLKAMKMAPTSQVQSHENGYYKSGPKQWKWFLQTRSKAMEMVPTSQVQSHEMIPTSQVSSNGNGSYKPGPKPRKWIL